MGEKITGKSSVGPITQTIRVALLMGSNSDWASLRETAATLEELGIPHEVMVISAHRTPGLLYEWAERAEGRGLDVIIAGAGGAAHLPGMLASLTLVPVIGVPIYTEALGGLDSLLSISQMPSGVGVATVAIGRAGAVNAALLAAQILGGAYREAVRSYRAKRRQDVMDNPDPREAHGRDSEKTR